MKITLNGAHQDVPDGLTVLALLEHLNIQSERVAVELNADIVRKAAYGSTIVKDGDSVEVVSFMGGGGGQIPITKLQIPSNFRCQSTNVQYRSELGACDLFGI